MSNCVSLPVLKKNLIAFYEKWDQYPADKRPAVILRGPPGCAKSAIVKEVARHFGTGYHEVHGVVFDGVELVGIPRINEKNEQYRALTDLLPKDPNFEGFIALEEYGNCDAVMRKGYHHLLYDRMLANGWTAPNKAMFILTTNGPEDMTNAVAVEPTMMNRVFSYDVCHDAEAWVAYQATRQCNPMVLAWIRQKPDAIYCKPKNRGESFPSYRTWDMAATVLDLFSDDPELYEPMIRGALGAEHAREFLEFIRLREHMIPLSAVQADPDNCAIPTRTDIAYLMLYSLNNATSAGSVGMTEATKYIRRFGMEFRQLWVSLVKEDVKRYQHPAFTKLCVENGMAIYKSGVY